jgi:hypothetical protein
MRPLPVGPVSPGPNIQPGRMCITGVGCSRLHSAMASSASSLLRKYRFWCVRRPGGVDSSLTCPCGRPDQAGRADVDHLRDAVRRGGIQDVARAIHVGAVQLVPMIARRVIFAKIGGRMHQQVAAGELTREAADRAQIALHYGHIAGHVEARGLGGRARQRFHRVAGGQERIDDVAAQQARGACNEYAHTAMVLKTPSSSRRKYRTASGTAGSCTPPCRPAAPCSFATSQTARGRARRRPAAGGPSSCAPSSAVRRSPRTGKRAVQRHGLGRRRFGVIGLLVH